MSLSSQTLKAPQDMADHFAGAHRSGVEAYNDGKPIRQCPYASTGRNGSALPRAWKKAWELGWVNAEREDNGLEPVTWGEASGFYSYPTDYRP